MLAIRRPQNRVGRSVPGGVLDAADEAELAWDLLDQSPMFGGPDRKAVCVVIGAGDAAAATAAMLRAYVRAGQPIPADLVPRVELWLRCYRDSEFASGLHDLLKAN